MIFNIVIPLALAGPLTKTQFRHGEEVMGNGYEIMPLATIWAIGVVILGIAALLTRPRG